MQLMRFAVVKLHSPHPGAFRASRDYSAKNGVQLGVLSVSDPYDDRDDPDAILGGDPLVNVLSLTQPGTAILVAVAARLSGLAVECDSEGRPTIPSQARQDSETAIEEFADLMSVLHQCRRDVASPRICVALEPEEDESFGGSTDISVPRTAQSLPRMITGDWIAKIPALTQDRIEGQRLLSAALSGHSALGKAREYFRLFEAAFSKNINGLSKELHRFLVTGPHAMGFTKRELDAWIKLRGPASHADRAPSWDADVAPALQRMEWAAYDLLMNKKVWGHADATRRHGILFSSGHAVSGELLRFSEAAASVVIQPATGLDKYGIYPVTEDLQISLSHPLASDEHAQWVYSPVVRAPSEDETKEHENVRKLTFKTPPQGKRRH